MSFYMSVLALADTGKYITEGSINVFLNVNVGFGVDTGKYIAEGCLNMFLHVYVGSG